VLLATQIGLVDESRHGFDWNTRLQHHHVGQVAFGGRGQSTCPSIAYRTTAWTDHDVDVRGIWAAANERFAYEHV
jgi:hypothetical protein